MKLYRTASGYIVEQQDRFYAGTDTAWDQLVMREDLEAYLTKTLEQQKPLDGGSFAGIEKQLLPPIGSQEVWASGVTYYRSRNARMEEAKIAGGGDFYERVYVAERPELFMKATPNRVVGHLGKVAIRQDATWSVPEPELTLLANPAGKIVGYTIGNDMSSRDIEGENPLYLPQAKVYDRSCALGPGIPGRGRTDSSVNRNSIADPARRQDGLFRGHGAYRIEAQIQHAAGISLPRQ